MSDDNVPLKEYFEARVVALEKATILAAHQMERRLEGMNEFREQLKDQAGQFQTKQEANLRWDNFIRDQEAIKSDIRILRESRAMLEGKASQQSVNVATILAVVGIVLWMVDIVVGFLRSK
jgi:hypothetical protein